MFKAVYESPIHDPLLFWAANAIFFAALSRQMRPFVAYLALFAVAIAADATLTGALSPLPASSPLATPVSVLFVVLGDARFFLLVARCQPASRGFARALPAALAASLVVPIVSFVVPRLAPGRFADVRSTFLLYEALFFALASALLSGLLPWARRAPANLRRYLYELSAFEAAQYALWAAADVAILAGHDAGFALRLAPNAMYYAGFLPFAWLRAPDELKRPDGR